MLKSMKSVLLSGVALAAIASSSMSALAGGFMLREQSAVGTGMANAGAAAGGAGLGSIFWNPAALSKFSGLQSYSTVTGILPSGQNIGTTATYAPFGMNSGEIFSNAILPASAYSWQISDRAWAGLTIGTPYGLETRNPVVAATSPFAIHSKIMTISVTPMLAYKLTDWLTIGVGLQLQYGKALLTLGLPAPTTPTAAVAQLKGTGWAGGVTAGAFITPMAGTEIGLGYRSMTKTDLAGTFAALGNYIPTSFSAGTADVYTIGIRQRITNDFDLLAGFEYDNWHLGVLPVINTLTNTQLTLSGNPVSVPFRFKNGWMVSLGGEYRVTKDVTLRAGLASERAPIDDTNRRPSLPEGDRFWTSIGASWNFSATDRLDFGYSHIFVKGGNVSVSSGPIVYNGTTKGHADLVSLGWNHTWSSAPSPVLVARY